MKTFIMVDVETDGPIPGDYSMISLGAVVIDKNLDKTFYETLAPISKNYQKERLKISKFTREETINFKDPKIVMQNFSNWVINNIEGKAIFISDNNGFDWMFICWYFHHFIGTNPFGYSSWNLQSLYRGFNKDLSYSLNEPINGLVHNALEDALFRAKQFLELIDNFK